jgi:opacity protein-like surface antigen
MCINEQRLLRIVVLLVVLVVMTATASFSERPNSLEPGSWALQFRITTDFNLAAFEYGQLSIKRQFTSKSAVRASINLGFHGRDETGYGDVEKDREGSGVEISTLYQRYLNPERRGSFYWGVGPLFEIASAETENRHEGFLERRDSYDRWELGVRGVAGVEWFATRSISLHAEYRVLASYWRSKDKEELFSETGESSVREYETDQWAFTENGSVLFGVSLYF